MGDAVSGGRTRHGLGAPATGALIGSYGPNIL